MSSNLFSPENPRLCFPTVWWNESVRCVILNQTKINLTPLAPDIFQHYSHYALPLHILDPRIIPQRERLRQRGDRLFPAWDRVAVQAWSQAGGHAGLRLPSHDASPGPRNGRSCREEGARHVPQGAQSGKGALGHLPIARVGEIPWHTKGPTLLKKPRKRWIERLV